MAGKHLLPLTIGLLSANFIPAVFSQAQVSWERPPEFIASWGQIHSRVGSYYNGSVNLNFGVVNNTEYENHLYPGDACRPTDELTLHYDGFVRIGRPDPELSGDNAIALGMISWDRKLTLEGLDDLGVGTGEEDFKISSEIHEGNVGDEEPPMWKIAVNSAGDDGYHFNATSTPTARGSTAFDLLLNLTEPCTEVAGPRPSDEKDSYYVFIGDILDRRNVTSDDSNFTLLETTTPQIEGRFNGDEATFSLVAPYMMDGGDSTLVQGVLNVTFSGKLDPELSDQLLLGQDQPDWKKTILGEQSDQEDQDSASTAVANMVLACGMTVFVLGFIMA